MKRHCALLSAALCLGCASAPPTPAAAAAPASPAILPTSLTGTVTYRERLALPPGATVTVLVWDALAELPASKLGETKFETQGKQVPLAFEVFFDPDTLQPTHTYAARASIHVDGGVWFESGTPVPVLTQGAPSAGVELLVKRMAPLP
jgi:putative lipoprotein